MICKKQLFSFLSLSLADARQLPRQRELREMKIQHRSKPPLVRGGGFCGAKLGGVVRKGIK